VFLSQTRGESRQNMGLRRLTAAPGFRVQCPGSARQHRRCSPGRRGDRGMSPTGTKTDASLEIRVMGELAVFCDGEQLSLPRSRKTRALLAYLAVTGQPQSRERICEMFWDVPDDPRGSLRWSLSKLRQILNHAGTNSVV